MIKMQFYMQKMIKIEENKIDDFYHFLYVKFHFGHKKWTYQK